MQLAVRLAAAEAGVWACDTVYGTVSDPDGLHAGGGGRAPAGLHRQVLHPPTQVPLANAVFRPSDAEIAAALRVVEAARGAEANGVGAFLVDGRMIDIPFITARRGDRRRRAPARPTFRLKALREGYLGPTEARARRREKEPKSAPDRAGRHDIQARGNAEQVDDEGDGGRGLTAVRGVPPR